LTLVIASYIGSYTGPSDDFWLTASTSANITTIQADNTTVTIPQYTLNQEYNVLACTEQHQFCNPSNATTTCTPFLSIDQYQAPNIGPLNATLFNTVFDNDYQNTIAQIIYNAAYQPMFNNILTNVIPPLMAAGISVNGASPPLPANQWILEATNWVSIGMVNLQRTVVDTATGPPGDSALYTKGQADGNAALEWYCANQVIQSSGFTSFSVLAISLIVAFGSLLIVVSLVIESVVSWWQLKYKRGLYHQVRWQLDSTLQLQRMVFEEVGLGTWEGGAEDVPVTGKGEVFRVAEEWDEWHPSIRGKAVGKRGSVAGRSVGGGGRFF
jgi:hypothetical protein